MDQKKVKTWATAKMSRRHVVAMPYPGRGHVNPMLNLCRLLLSKSPQDFLITFIVTQEWLGFLRSESEPQQPALHPNLRFSAVEQVIPSEIDRAAAPPGSFYEAALTKLPAPFERLLDRLEPPPTAIIYDTFLSWVVGVGNRRNIPVASLFTMSASVFSVFSHFDLLVQRGHFPIDVSERGGEIVDYIPGLASTTIANLSTLFHGDGRKILDRVLEAVSIVNEAQYLLVTSIPEFEGEVIYNLKAKLSIPIYHIGPMIPHFDLKKNETKSTQKETYFQWLDLQPKDSVLYISHGSFRSIPSSQMNEIVAGIKESGVRYMWITRRDHISPNSMGETGIQVSWCDQLNVLNHPSVGGFWTHCGWNSTLEAVYAGVPMLTYPISSDQIPNCKMIVDDWKIGWRVLKKDHKTERIVAKQEIIELVRKFMDLESVERIEMLTRVEHLREILKGAIMNSGSAESHLDGFLKNIIQ